MPSVLVQCLACCGRYNIQRGSSLNMTRLTSQGFQYTATRQAVTYVRCPSSFSLATQATLQSITGKHQLRVPECPPQTRDYSAISQLAEIWLPGRQENRKIYESVLLGVSKASVKRKTPEQGNLINDSTSSRKQEEINILNNGGSETTVTVNTLSERRLDNINECNSRSTLNNTGRPSQISDDTVALLHDSPAEFLGVPSVSARLARQKNDGEKLRTKPKSLENSGGDNGGPETNQRSPIRGNGQREGRGPGDQNVLGDPRVAPPPRFLSHMRFLNIRTVDVVNELDVKQLESTIKCREYWGPVRIRSHICPTMPLADIAILLMVEDRPPIRQNERNARQVDTRIYEELIYYTGTEINLAESPPEND